MLHVGPPLATGLDLVAFRDCVAEADAGAAVQPGVGLLVVVSLAEGVGRDFEPSHVRLARYRGDGDVAVGDFELFVLKAGGCA